jgi:hypothetical protein
VFCMKVGRRVIAEVHGNDDAVEPTDFRHVRMPCKAPAGREGGRFAVNTGSISGCANQTDEQVARTASRELAAADRSLRPGSRRLNWA